MTLDEYLDREKLTQDAFAKRVGVSQGMVWQWLNGRREVVPRQCVVIEQVTAGAVRRWDLRPDDWHRIWPELITVPGAPAAPVAGEAA